MASLTEYIENVQENRRERFDGIMALIGRMYPKAELSMKYRMPTWELDDGWIALANQKQYISVYTCGEVHLAAFKALHPEVKTGKGCINIRNKDAFSLDDLAIVVSSAMENRL